MRASIISRIALSAAIAAAAATPAAAQSMARENVRTEVRTAAMVRPLAQYRFTISRAVGLPADVTVADSAGTLVATYRFPGDRIARPMLVQVLDTDLVLQAETESGVLTLQLFKQNDSSFDEVAGTWSLGSRSGELRGKATR